MTNAEADKWTDAASEDIGLQARVRPAELLPPHPLGVTANDGRPPGHGRRKMSVLSLVVQHWLCPSSHPPSTRGFWHADGMEMLLRWGRAYWRLNERAWTVIRRAETPLLALAGVAAALSWVIGVRTGNPALLWAPALYGCAIFAGSVLARR